MPSEKSVIRVYDKILEKMHPKIQEQIMNIADIDFEQTYPTIYIRGWCDFINWKVKGMEGMAFAQ